MGREWSFFFLSRVALTQQEKAPPAPETACVLACLPAVPSPAAQLAPSAKLHREKK